MAAYQQYTRAQLRDQLQDRYENSPYWTVTDANRAINQALRVWNSLVGFWRTTVTVSALSGDHTVALPGTLLYRTRVALADGTPIPIVSRFELNRVQPNWRYEFVNSGGSIPSLITVCAPIGLYTLRVWPAAAPLSLVNIPLTVNGIAATPVLTADGQYVDLGDEDLGPLLDECLHIVSFKHGGERFAKTLPLHRRFLKAAGERNTLLLASKAFRRYAGLDRSRDLRPYTNPAGAESVNAAAAVTAALDRGED